MLNTSHVPFQQSNFSEGTMSNPQEPLHPHPQLTSHKDPNHRRQNRKHKKRTIWKIKFDGMGEKRRLAGVAQTF